MECKLIYITTLLPKTIAAFRNSIQCGCLIFILSKDIRHLPEEIINTKESLKNSQYVDTKIAFISRKFEISHIIYSTNQILFLNHRF